MVVILIAFIDPIYHSLLYLINQQLQLLRQQLTHLPDLIPLCDNIRLQHIFIPYYRRTYNLQTIRTFLINKLNEIRFIILRNLYIPIRKPVINLQSKLRLFYRILAILRRLYNLVHKQGLLPFLGRLNRPQFIHFILILLLQLFFLQLKTVFIINVITLLHRANQIHNSDPLVIITGLNPLYTTSLAKTDAHCHTLRLRPHYIYIQIQLFVRRTHILVENLQNHFS